MMVHDNCILVQLQGPVRNLSDTDPADKFIVVDRGDQHLGRGIGLSCRRRNVVNNGIKEGRHVLLLVLEVFQSIAVLGGAEYEGGFQLVIICIKVHEKFKNFIDDLGRTCLGTVDLVDVADDRQVQSQGLHQDELGLGHDAFESIDHEDAAINHLQDPLYLTAEIRMAGGIDNIDLDAVVIHGCILGKDGDAALPLDVAGIHDPLGHCLIVPEDAGLAQEVVHKRRLAVVDMGYNRDVPDILSCLHNSLPSFL